MKSILKFSFLATIILSVCSRLLEKTHHIFHLLVHFQLQYWVIITIGTFVFLWQKKWKLFGIGMIFTVCLFAWIHPVQLFKKPISSVEVFFLNAQYDLKDSSLILETITELNPKTVSIVESNPELVNEVSRVLGEPILNHRAYASSCTVFSGDHVSTEVIGKTHLPICVVKFDEYTLITIHAHRPIEQKVLEENIEFFDQIHEMIQKLENDNEKFLLVGDFNSTIYSAYFRERFEKYFIKNLYTWKTNSLISLPIDHALSNIDVEISKTGNVGSDHVGVLVEMD